MECKNCVENQEGRAHWGPGPWQGEPDFFELAHAGLRCQLHRGFWGIWGGYVGVNVKHPYYRKWHDDLGLRTSGLMNWSGWFAAHAFTPPCGKPAHGTWWLGFEFSAPYQMAPRAAQLCEGLEKWHYKTYEEATEEVKRLATQIADAAWLANAARAVRDVRAFSSKEG